MVGSAKEDSSVGMSLEVISGGHQGLQSGEALAEWRSAEQVQNGTPSASPPYRDTDDDDDCGPKPSELYGKYTWKIDEFSQINKRELRSNAFEVGGYEWYILIYPQGCDVCNHLSLFLCVANHDKLLPGWNHFAQFTIAVVNKDPKKSKYSDTLHRFWKKEHDWGWKKFMELSKVFDGFIDADTLIIKAQVQVIRERVDRPFRCLDCQYRRELVRVYLTNVEQICRRFVEERRGKLGKLIEDKARWSSFCAFWLGMDRNSQRLLSMERTDSILKVVVKHFFVEKEVTTSLVMDFLYSGLKALESQNHGKKGRGNYLDAELPVPVVRIEKDMFVLVDDVLPLIERAVMEPLPPKDEKGPQNRTKDAGFGEDFNKDSIERDERRLTELGRRTIEIFVLAHVFSKLEVSYQEAVAWKRQEELIREEEAAWLAGSVQKAKHGGAEKEKKLKRKQGKQKRNHHKGNNKGRGEKSIVVRKHKAEPEYHPTEERKDFLFEQSESVLEKADPSGDASDVSDTIDCVPKTLSRHSDDRDASPVSWDTDISEVHPSKEAISSGMNDLSAVQNGVGEKGSQSMMDDSSSSCSTGLSAVQDGVGGRKSLSSMDDCSSTCSTESVPSVVVNGPYKGNLATNNKILKFQSRGWNNQRSASSDPTDWSNEVSSQPFKAVTDVGQGQEVFSLQRKVCVEDNANSRKLSVEKMTKEPSPPRRTSKSTPSAVQLNSDSVVAEAQDPVSVTKSVSDSLKQYHRMAILVTSAESTVTSGPEVHKVEASKQTERPVVQQAPATIEKLVSRGPVILRPSSSLIPRPRPTAPVGSMVESPLIAHTVSIGGRLIADPVPTTHGSIPPSYGNAMMDKLFSCADFTQPHSPNSAVYSSHSFSQLPSLISTAVLLPQSPARLEPKSNRTSFSFGMVDHDVLQNAPEWLDCPQGNSSRSIHSDSLLVNDIQNFDLHKPPLGRFIDHISSEFPACTSGQLPNGVFVDEFPHLDIINDLLDDEQAIGKAAGESSSFQSFSNGAHLLNRQFTFPGDIGMSFDAGPSTSSSRFERIQSYHDNGFQRFSGPFQDHFRPLRDTISQARPQPYANGQIDGLIPNQWQMTGSNTSFLSMKNRNGDGYSYHIPKYSNLGLGVNGYAGFRP